MDPLPMVPSGFISLNKKRCEYLTITDKAVRKHPKIFSELRIMVEQILSNSIDVSQYYRLATQLAEQIQAMGKETIFYHYFFENIHPDIRGRARYFRSMCRDLKNQVDEFNRWRCRTRNIRLLR